jgi:hypothetical protein
MWAEGWTDSHHVPNTGFSDMCDVPDTVNFVFNLKCLETRTYVC